MRHSPRHAALLVSWIAFLVIVAPVPQAASDEACHATCEEQETGCIESCSEHSNPMDCEATCHEDAEDCLEACGQ